MNISLLMALYHRDDPTYFKEALDSIRNSTLLPEEIVIVQDGPVPISLLNILSEYSLILPLLIITLPKNLGLGNALRIGVQQCKNEWIARFDSDDIMHTDRLRLQSDFISANPNVEIVGGNIIEFGINLDDQLGKRYMPLSHESIYKFARHRCPFNHMTVMFLKKSVLNSGNYGDEYLFEDYALWVRMILNGAVMANLEHSLVFVRTGNGMYARRGGWKYAKREFSILTTWWSIGFLSTFNLVFNLITRFPMRLVPTTVRRFVYRKLLRKTI